MSVAEYCNREVAVISKDASITEAANLMRSYHVGALVVVERSNEKTSVFQLKETTSKKSRQFPLSSDFLHSISSFS